MVLSSEIIEIVARSSDNLCICCIFWTKGRSLVQEGNCWAWRGGGECALYSPPLDPPLAKPNQLGKWRLILDISYPSGGSVNDGVDPNLCSLHYTSVDTAIAQILSLSQKFLMAKINIAQVYRNVPVHPGDHPLLGMQYFVH